MISEHTQPLKVFISYSHADKIFCNKLLKVLSPLIRRGILKLWYDDEINVGDVWSRAIDNKLKESDIVIFLLSWDFIASDFIGDKEIKPAMDGHRKGTKE